MDKYQILYDLKEEIVANITKNDLIAIKKNLTYLKELGYTSNEVYSFISDLRKDFYDCPEEDLILEVLDICSNFCGSSLQVWD